MAHRFGSYANYIVIPLNKTNTRTMNKDKYNVVVSD